jgi:hypothetical protein
MHESAVVDPSDTENLLDLALCREKWYFEWSSSLFHDNRIRCTVYPCSCHEIWPVPVPHCLLERLPVSVQLSREVGAWLRVLRLSEKDHLLDKGAY